MGKEPLWITSLGRRNTETWEAQILRQWKRAIAIGSFPYLTTDEHQAFARACLTAFRSRVEWLIIFEILTYVGEADAFIDKVYAYGNRAKPRLEWVEFLCQPPGNLNIGWPDPFDFEIVLHGQPYHFTPAHTDYTQAGINLDAPISGDLMLDRRVQVLRLLTFLLPAHEVFLPEPKLREVVGRPELPPLFLQLHEWHHPEAEKELQDSPCLRSLARAIAYNRPDLYECPPNLVNTHWSQWPNYFLNHR